ncbi:MAG: hypothetical protein PHQ35_06630 [Phycisphaerae bacterium]|nr:hypothetical protein [Phycisphaerae bacterium]MDD5381146.1 hypothetical protein [Phycisphaerae bacterium]
MATKKNVKNQTKLKELTCFIIMPFSDIKFKASGNKNKTLSEKKLSNIYKHLFKRAVESYDHNNVHFTANRYTSQRGNFVKGIISHLDTADLVMADLTGLNHNVFYELGIRHTLKCGTLMLTQNKKELAADLSNYIAMEYTYPEVSCEFNKYYLEFEKELHIAIDEVLDNPDRSDNPVRDFIGDRNIFHNEQRIKEVKTNMEFMRMLQLEYWSNVSALLRCFEKWRREGSTIFQPVHITAKPFLQRLMLLGEDIEVIEFVKNLSHDIEVMENNKVCLRDYITGKTTYKPQFSFRDYQQKYHHVLDLQKYYTGKRDLLTLHQSPEPICKSFNYFIGKWEKELGELIK